MRWRIRYQLLVPLLILLSGAVAVSAWVAVGAAARVRDGIEDRVRHVAQTLSESPQFPLVASVLEQMKKLSGADYLLVSDAGRVSTLQSEPIELSSAEAVVDDWRTLKLGPLVTVAGEPYRCSGVRLRPPREGQTLYILYPEALWRDALWQALWPVLVLGGTTALAAILLAVVLGQRLAGRIQELERRTSIIAAGNFSPMPLPDRDDEVRDLAGSVNEMAQQLVRYQETLLRSERLRLLGQVGGGLAHQLRNGLTGARLALQVYTQEQAGLTDTAALDVALRQLTLLETHLKRFLNLGRQDDLRSEPIALATLLSEAVEMLRAQCRHAGIGLLWHAPAMDSTIKGDAGQLGQVVVNLLTNAIEAAGPGGTVEVRCIESRSDDRNGVAPNGRTHASVVLEVWDTGPGPVSPVVDRLFEPFVTSKPEGVGLGLAVVRQVVEAHGGHITWHRANGRTVFRVELPRTSVLEPSSAGE